MTHKQSDAQGMACPLDKPAQPLSAMDMHAAYNYADIHQIVEAIEEMQAEDRKKSRKRKRREVHL